MIDTGSGSMVTADVHGDSKKNRTTENRLQFRGAMTQRKARSTTAERNKKLLKNVMDESPVVSDDDGVEEAARALGASGTTFPAMSDVEHLSDYSSSSEPDISKASPHARIGGESIDSGAESDSTIEGDINPVGDIPMHWYDGYDHIGYTQDGEKFVPKNKPSALDLAADPHAWRRIYDEKNDEQLTLTHAELKAIARMKTGHYPGAPLDDQGEVIAWSGPVRDAPLPGGTEPKRRFLPSRHEARLVVRYVRAMREGRMMRPSERRAKRDDSTTFHYDIWEGHEPKTQEEMSKSERARDIMRVPAPKVPLPKHDESYNPPAEYLPTKEEQEEWEKTDVEDRVSNYLPTKQDALRHVPLYENFVKERFERCLDLYLAVRIKKDAEQITADDLVPKLPRPRDLRPFPTGKVLEFGPLPSRARSIDVHPAGQWLISGSDDGIVRLWEIATGFLRAEWSLGERLPKIDDRVQPVMNVAWRPSGDSFVFAACVGKSLFIIEAASALGVADIDADEVLQGHEVTESGKGLEENGDGEEGEKKNEEGENSDGDSAQNGVDESKVMKWLDRKVEALSASTNSSTKSGMVEVTHPRALRACTWHRRGDYIGTIGKDSSGGTVAIHRLTQRSSKILFRRRSSGVQCIRFHPTRPFFLVATMHHVRIYNLAAEEAVKVLKPGVRWISSIDVHSSGDHVLVTSYDKRLCWFDLDLSVRPYKTLRNHEKAVRAAKYHPRLPLFADSADDGAVHVFHGMVYDDLAKNALIVPVKKLEDAHKVVDSLGVLDIAWHPRLPWLLSSGADRRICLFTDTS